MKQVQSGFAFVDVIISIAIVSMMALLIAISSNSYHKNLVTLRSLDQVETIVQNELMLLSETKHNENKHYDQINVTYQVLEEIRVGEANILRLRMLVEDLENDTKKECEVLCQVS